MKNYAAKLNELLTRCIEAQKQAEEINGHKCCSVKSIQLLDRLSKEIDKVSGKILSEIK